MEPARTVATQYASVRERRVAAALVAMLVVATIVALPFYDSGVAVQPAFVPAFVGSTGMADALAAALLFNLYRIDRRRLVLFAACGYLFNTLLIIPYFLTFPEIVLPSQAFGNVQSAASMWITWHFCFAVSIIAGASWRDAESTQANELRRLLVPTILFAVGAATYATAGHAYLPQLLAGGHFTRLFGLLAAVTSSTNIVAAYLLLRAGRLSSLRLWLVVALFASALDTALNGVSPERYSAAWYVGKMEQFVTATVVLFSMLGAWSTSHRRAKELADRLATALASRRVLQDGFDREHRSSMAFQQAALPSELPMISGLHFSALYRAASLDSLVGGDWYDAFSIDDGRVVLSVGDVMGSGLEAAVTMNAMRQAMRGAAQLFPDPVAILDAADRALRSERPESIVTACVAVLDTVARSITYASAGHPPPLWRMPDGAVVELGRSGLPLGLRPMLADAPDTTQTLSIPEPSMLVFYTDGLTEATRDSLDGETRLRALIGGETLLSAIDPANAIANAMLEEAADDVAIMTVLVDSGLRVLDRNDERQKMSWTFDASDGERAGDVRQEMFGRLVAAGASEGEITTGELVFSELVANVQRHCGGLVDVILDLRRPLPVLHVLDSGPGFAFVSRLPSSMFSESGRGLYIVAQVTRDFSVAIRPGGGSHARAVLALSTPGSKSYVEAIPLLT